ncbi:uncharacterized protein LOC133373970 [Rhineura floridana]|uniref:uncharacterized protein LOC133373970 n=1 Tax=Rhineura floridana TaxID=261503 RepID=UPI002AC880BC|nr:uncharacterized protein LOC133373970 [Rhineura floridana]
MTHLTAERGLLEERLLVRKTLAPSTGHKTASLVPEEGLIPRLVHPEEVPRAFQEEQAANATQCSPHETSLTLCASHLDPLGAPWHQTPSPRGEELVVPCEPREPAEERAGKRPLPEQQGGHQALEGIASTHNMGRPGTSSLMPHFVCTTASLHEPNTLPESATSPEGSGVAAAPVTTPSCSLWGPDAALPAAVVEIHLFTYPAAEISLALTQSVPGCLGESSAEAGLQPQTPDLGE